MDTVEFRLSLEEIQEHLVVPCVQRVEVLTAIVQEHVEYSSFVFCFNKKLVRIIFGELLDFGRYALLGKLRDENQLMVNVWQ